MDEEAIKREIDRIVSDLQMGIAESSDDMMDSFLGFEAEAAMDRLLRLSAKLSASRRQPVPRAPRSPSFTPTARKRQRKASEYQKWAAKERPKIRKQHPRFSFGRINQELGKRWKREKKKRGIK